MTSPFHNTSCLVLVHDIPRGERKASQQHDPYHAPEQPVPSHTKVPHSLVLADLFFSGWLLKALHKTKIQQVAKKSSCSRQTHTRGKMKEDNLHLVHISHFIIAQTIPSHSPRRHLSAIYAPMAVFTF